MSFLLLPRIQVQTANALACGFIVNASPVMAVTQFAHNIGRQLGCEIRGVAIRHHHGEHQALEDMAFNALPNQRRSALLINNQDYAGGGKNGPSLSAQPTASCNLELSLLIECSSLPSGAEGILTRFLRKGRLAGGQITDYQPLLFADEPGDMRAAIDKSLGGSGYWLIERSDLMDASDPLGSMFSALEHDRLSEEEALKRKKNDSAYADMALHEITHAWVVPTVLGYHALTGFKEREGVRLQAQPDGSLETSLHAYAEPLVGLVQYVSARQWLTDELPFWRQQWLDPNTFVVQCHLDQVDDLDALLA